MAIINTVVEKSLLGLEVFSVVMIQGVLGCRFFSFRMPMRNSMVKGRKPVQCKQRIRIQIASLLIQLCWSTLLHHNSSAAIVLSCRGKTAMVSLIGQTIPQYPMLEYPAAKGVL